MSNVSITVSNPTFYTENITGPKKNDRGWWTMDIDRFAPKSMLTIYSALDSSKLNTPFDVFITYDEGSKWNSFVLSEENQLKEKVDKTSLDITTPIVSIIGAGVAFFIARLYLRVKRHTVIRYGRLLNKLAHDMCVVVLYIKNKENTFNETLSGKLFSVSFWDRETGAAKLKLIRVDSKGDAEYNTLEHFF
jgi:hypothetical protein